MHWQSAAPVRWLREVVHLEDLPHAPAQRMWSNDLEVQQRQWSPSVGYSRPNMKSSGGAAPPLDGLAEYHLQINNSRPPEKNSSDFFFFSLSVRKWPPSRILNFSALLYFQLPSGPSSLSWVACVHWLVRQPCRALFLIWGRYSLQIKSFVSPGLTPSILELLVESLPLKGIPQCRVVLSRM